MNHQSDESRKSSSEETPSLRPRLGLAISIVALLVIALHLIWPQLKIDAVTLVLIGVAAVPWLAPIFKSIELPGGLRFEYQEIQRQVREVEQRVEDIEQLVVSGDTTPQLQQRLTAAVQAFAAYLREIEPGLSVPPPAVHLKAGLRNAQYSKQGIEIDPDFAEEPYAVQREYAHHVLITAQGGASPDQQSGYAGLESGLADYLIASFTGEPGLGKALARWYRENYPGYEGRYIRNLASDAVLDPSTTPQQQGEVWGAAFWELRGWLGKARTDKLLGNAWLNEKWIASGSSPTAFPVLSATELTERDHSTMREIFERRHLPIAV